MSRISYFWVLMSLRFQSTSSEEDVVSFFCDWIVDFNTGFNPRPPKRTLCPYHLFVTFTYPSGFNPRPPKRTLCLTDYLSGFQDQLKFQSTSSEEDVVSYVDIDTCIYNVSFNPRPPKRTLCRYTCRIVCVRNTPCFNPRPPKRTLCHVIDAGNGLAQVVSIHVLRRGRCVYPIK